MNCVKTGYKNQETANCVIRKSACSKFRNQKLTRVSYKCPNCDQWHIRKYEVGRFT